MGRISPHSPLGRVACTILNELGEIPVLKYNKLLYLFEYLYIKNFGRRYTGESFKKINKGPVVDDYKNQILKLKEHGFVEVDEEELFRSNQSNPMKSHLRIPSEKHQKPIKTLLKTNMSTIS